MTTWRRLSLAFLALSLLAQPSSAQVVSPVDANFWAELAVKVEAMSPAQIAGAAGRVEQTVAVTAGRFNPYTGAAVVGGGLIVGALDWLYNEAKDAAGAPLSTGTSLDDYYRGTAGGWYSAIGPYKCNVTKVTDGGELYAKATRTTEIYQRGWNSPNQDMGAHIHYIDDGSYSKVGASTSVDSMCTMPQNWYETLQSQAFQNYSHPQIWYTGSPQISSGEVNRLSEIVRYSILNDGMTNGPQSIPLSDFLNTHPDAVTALKEQVIPKYLDSHQPQPTSTPWPGVRLNPPPTPTQWNQTDPVPVGDPTTITSSNPDGGSTTTSTQPYDNGTSTVTTTTSTPVATRNPDGTTTTTITTTSSRQKYAANGQPVGSPVVTTTSTTSTSTPVSTTSTTTTNPDGSTTIRTTTKYSDGTQTVTDVTTGTVTTTNPDGSQDVVTTTTTTTTGYDKSGNVVGTPKVGVTSTTAHTAAPDPSKPQENEKNCTASGGTWTGTSCTPSADPAKTACLTAGGTYADGVCTPNPTKPPPFVQANCTRGTLAVSSFVSDFFGTLRAVFVPCKDHFTELRDAVRTKFPFSIGAGLNNLMTPAGGSNATPLPTDLGWFQLDFAPYAVFFSLSQLLWKSFLTIALTIWLVGKASGQLVIN
jgi:hypothetical protein